MSEIGNIPTWGEKVTTAAQVEVRQWPRSFRQSFDTGFDREFAVEGMMEILTLTTYPDGTRHVKHEDAGVLRVTASQAASDPEIGPHALAIQEHMTAMFGILWQRKVDAAKAATEEPAPEPPAVPE